MEWLLAELPEAMRKAKDSNGKTAAELAGPKMKDLFQDSSGPEETKAKKKSKTCAIL